MVVQTQLCGLDEICCRAEPRFFCDRKCLARYNDARGVQAPRVQTLRNDSEELLQSVKFVSQRGKVRDEPLTDNQLKGFTITERNQRVFLEFTNDMGALCTERMNACALKRTLGSLHQGLKQKFKTLNGSQGRVLMLESIFGVANMTNVRKSIVRIGEIFKLDKTASNTKLIVVADQAIYAMLEQLEGEFKWLFPYPGDWHVLKNAQAVILKKGWDVGVKDLAFLLFSKGKANSLIEGNLFRRKHYFILCLYESLLRSMFDAYEKDRVSGTNADTEESKEPAPLPWHTELKTKLFTDHED
jgi:hypothetical protein